jgi:chromosome segregation ATPase
MDTYLDRSLIKLRRKYGKDELVASLTKQLSEKDVELGKLKSEIEHLEHELNATDIDKEVTLKARTEVRREEMYKSILEQNKQLKEQNKSLKKHRDELLSKINNP